MIKDKLKAHLEYLQDKLNKRRKRNKPSPFSRVIFIPSDGGARGIKMYRRNHKTLKVGPIMGSIGNERQY